MKKDRFTKKAKKQGYRARSVYKFFSLNKRFNIVKPKDKVLDLGCWPGSWIQALEKTDCKVVGVDLTKMKYISSNVTFLEGDITKIEIQNKIKMHSPYDVVLSDLSPKTTGVKEIDQEKSLELSLTALKIAIANLKKNGNFLCKIFQGPDSEELAKKAKKYFKQVRATKPEASKKRSKEIYLVCKMFNS